MPRQAYTERWNRRSQRTRMVKPHISNLYYLLSITFRYHASKRTPSDILSGGRTPEEVKEFEEASFLNQDLWLAAMIMSGNRECIDWLSEAMTSETNFKKMTYEHFRAIARSGNHELLELEGKLLMAARLQEGLRQAIVETMDCGLPESFIHIFNVIRDNNLQRFASVKRGVAVTTGLGEQDAPDRITDKFINLIHSYINSRDEARKGIESDNAMDVFLGLWATGFVEVLDTVPLIEKLIAEAPAYKVEAAMLYLECSNFIRSTAGWHLSPSTPATPTMPSWPERLNIIFLKNPTHMAVSCTHGICATPRKSMCRRFPTISTARRRPRLISSLWPVFSTT